MEVLASSVKFALDLLVALLFFALFGAPFWNATEEVLKDFLPKFLRKNILVVPLDLLLSPIVFFFSMLMILGFVAFYAGLIILALINYKSGNRLYHVDAPDRYA